MLLELELPEFGISHLRGHQMVGALDVRFDVSGGWRVGGSPGELLPSRDSPFLPALPRMARGRLGAAGTGQQLGGAASN